MKTSPFAYRRSPGPTPRSLLAGAGRLPRPRAFTLLEMLVAVGAVTLIALGVSQVFRATGATIRAGRRLNHLNTYAAMMQRQLQADIGAMTRDGYLIIRNEEIRGPNDNGVKLFDDSHSTVRAPDPRWRRSDELQYFVHGDFTSLRAPEHPSRVPRSTTARIYYGHGLRRDPNDQQSEFAHPVRIDDDQSSGPWVGGVSNRTPPALGRTAPNGQTGPNQYAADWILLRHAALLLPPDDQDRLDPPPPPNSTLRNANATMPSTEWPDKTFVMIGQEARASIQVSLQPAQASLFQSLSIPPAFQLPTDADLVRDSSPLSFDTHAPQMGCGVVDIIACDLETIRERILKAKDFPTPPGTLSAPPPGVFPIPGMDIDGNPDSNAPGSAAWMHAWMRDGLPTNADGPSSNADSTQLTQPQPARGGRMRCEKEPPNYLCSGNGYPAGAAAREYRRTDQIMLAASNFVPNCTEFIVEWSFGLSYSTTAGPTVPQGQEGQLIWHGLQRYDDSSPRNHRYDNTAEHLYASPYDETGPDARITAFRLNNGQTVPWLLKTGIVHDWSLHLAQAQTPPPPRLYSYFGYVDPSFDPDRFPTPVGNGKLDDPTDAAQQTIDWPWPKLIRVTLTLVDPADPSLEQTFQFVFNVPATGAVNQ